MNRGVLGVITALLMLPSRGSFAQIVPKYLQYGDKDLLNSGMAYTSDPVAGALLSGLPAGATTFASLITQHNFPFVPEADDYAGTDRIFVGSTQLASHDGYSRSVERINGPQVIDLDYSVLLRPGQQINTLTLGVAADDFQRPTFGQPFTAKVNGVLDPVLTNTLNSLDQTHPKTQFFTYGVDISRLQPDNTLTLEIDNGGDGGDGWAVDFLTVGVTARSAQSVVLAWGAEVPVRIASDNYGEYKTYRDGRMPAASNVRDEFRSQVLNGVRDIFTSSGVKSISIADIKDADTQDSTVVYFTDPIDNSLEGIAYEGVDRFNRRVDDKVVVFLQGDAERVASTIAHELGHALGLRHVEPVAESDPGNSEVMDYDFTPGSPERFINAVSPIFDFGWGHVEHNPLFHLKRYVDGEGFDLPSGEWDTMELQPKEVFTNLLLQGHSKTLFDVHVSAGFPDSLRTVAHFGQISMEELSAISFSVSEGEFLRIVASSTPAGPTDILLSVGSPFESGAGLIQVRSNTAIEAFLQQGAGGSFVTLAEATVRNDDAPLAATWDINADGNWSTLGSWSGPTPNAVGAQAIFGSVTSAARMVWIDTPITVGAISLQSFNSYRLGGEYPVRLDVATGQAQIRIVTGVHTISAPMLLADDTVAVIAANSHLLITGPLISERSSLTKQGSGNLTISSVRAPRLIIEDGVVSLVPMGMTVSTVESLSIAGGVTPTATFDLNNAAAIVNYSGESPIATVRQQIIVGRGGPGLGAPWSGPGITSTAAASVNALQPESRSIGYAENGSLPLGPYATFRSEAVDGTAIIIAFTRTGDANLDGIVNDDDVTIMGAQYAPGFLKPHWALGDFDYSGFVDNDDVTLLGVFYDPGAPALGMVSAATVGEPNAWVLLALGIIGLLFTRRFQ